MQGRSFEYTAGWLAVAALFVLPFIALVVTPSLFFPFITGKNIAFRILTEVLFAGWLITALRDRSYLPRFSWILGVLGVLVGWMAVADVFGVSPLVSFWSNFERMEGWVTLFHLLLYVVAAAGIVGKMDLGKRLLQTHVASGVLVSLYTFLQYTGATRASRSANRAEATLGNAAYLGVYMLFNIFFALGLLLEERRNKNAKWFYGFAIALQTITLFLAATRGTMLGLVGGLLLAAVLIALFERESKKLRKTATGILVGLLVLGGLFFALRNTPVVQNVTALERLSSISLEDETTKIRLIVWEVALAGVQERPILGWGQEGFVHIFNQYYDPQLHIAEPWYDRAHNVFLDWATTGGVPALLIYLSLFGVSVYMLWRRESRFSVVERSVFTGLLAGYFVHNIFVFDNVTSYLLFGTTIAYVHAQGVRESSGTISEKHSRAWVPWAQGAVALAFIVAVYMFTVPAVRAAGSLVDALRVWRTDAREGKELFDTAFTYTDFGDPEIATQLFSAAIGVADTGQDEEVRSEFRAFAEERGENIVKAFPSDLRLRLSYASFLESAGLHEEAATILKFGRTLSLKKQQTLLMLAGNALSREAFEEAQVTAKEAFELAPDYDAARRVYAVVLIRTGMEEEAEALMEERYGTPFVLGTDFINAYASVRSYEKVIELWKLEISTNPQNAQAYVSLAATYYALGRINEAVGIIEEGIAANPSFESEGKAWIEQIRSGKLPRG